MQLTMKSLAKTDFAYTVFNLVSHGISLSVMFPAAFCAGMSLPLITFALLSKGYGESSIGKVYAWNTLGAIFGVMFAVHVAMPYFGLKALIIAGAAADIAVALALLWKLDRASSKVRWQAASVAGVAAVLFAASLVNFDTVRMASGVYRFGNLEDSSMNQSVFHRDGKTATIDVIRQGTALSIKTNGKPDATLDPVRPEPTSDDYTMVLAAALPMAYLPDARTFANIGFGSGLTTHTLLANPNIKSVDTVEIEPAMVEGARQFGALVERAYNDPRSTIYIDDAKSFFAGRNSKYDVIVSEPSNPWVSGVSSLFSDEFYKQIKRHINDGGMLVQWIQLYEIDTELVATIFKALGAHFSDYVVYDNNSGDMLILAVPNGTIGELNARGIRAPLLAAKLATIGIQSTDELRLQKVGSKKTLHKLFLSYGPEVNSDYFPIVDLHAPKSRFLQHSAFEIANLGIAPIPVMDMLEGNTIDSVTVNEARRSALSLRVKKTTIAHDIGEYFRTGAFPAATRLDSSARANVAYVRDKLVNCVEPERDNAWFDLLFEVAQPVSAHLPAAESERLWQLIEGAQCFSRLTATQKQWIALFKSVGNRNAPAMAALSQRLLEGGGVSRAQTGYLLMAGMTGLIVERDKAAALRLWERYEGEIGGKSSLPLRLLHVHSLAPE
jgi:predicted membrane-bound spermidine synthase